MARTYHGSDPISLIDGFPDNDRIEVARMYWDAFGVKLAVALSPRGKAIEMLASESSAHSSVQLAASCT